MAILQESKHRQTACTLFTTIAPSKPDPMSAPEAERERLGGRLNYYYRVAA